MYHIRPITPEDISQVLAHRVGMFTDMGENPPDEINAMCEPFRQWLHEQVPAGGYRGWFAVDDDTGKTIGGAGLWLMQNIPNPTNPAGRRGHVVDVYVQPSYRRRGVARALMTELLAWCEAEAIPMVTLHASDEGRTLYESLGFVFDNQMMWVR